MKKFKLSIHNIITLLKIMGKEQIFGLLLRILSLAVDTVLPLVLIYYQRKMIQSLQSDFTTDQMLLLSVLSIVSILFAQKLFGIIFGFINFVLNNQMSYKLEYTKHNKCVNAQLFAYDNHELYDKMNIASRISTTTVNDFISAFFEVTSSIIKFISFAIILGSFSILLLLGALIGAIPIIFVRKFSNKYEEFDKKRTPLIRRMNYFKRISTEGDYTKETKVFGMMPFICGEHKRYYDEWAKSELEYRDEDNRRRFIWQPTVSLFIMILPSLFLIWRVSITEIDVAGFTYYLSLLSLCHGAITSIINFYFDNRLADSRIKDYFDFMNMPIDSRGGDDVPSQWLKEMPEIEFKNVSFCYSGSESNAIDDISFIIKPNEKIALLGLNGAGKTTLIKLLCGLYEPSKGEIIIGGRNIIEFSQASLYRLFSVVFQDYMNYELPLDESLSLGSKKATINEIKQAFENIDGIELLEKRFSNDVSKVVGKTIDKEGVELSGGEHQKIAIARALLQNRSMIILDEPTSNLDAYAETSILKQFLTYNKNKPVIIVSHRLSATLFVDKIIVMENAKIIEQGTHSELIEKGGKYEYLFNLQSSQYK